MRGYDAPPNLPKDPLLATKWGFAGEIRGWGSKRSTFWGSRTPPPPSILATGLEKSFLFRQSGGRGHLDVIVYTWTSLVKLITKHVLSFHAKNKTKQTNKQKHTHTHKKNTTPVNEGVFIPNFTPKYVWAQTFKPAVTKTTPFFLKNWHLQIPQI